jgi:glycosyltransferase involved in cell wall biosynthesis
MRDLKDLKVCFLAGTLGRGGAERQLVYMLRALLGVGVAPRVICLTRGEAFEEEIKALRVPIEWVGSSELRPVRLAKIIRSLQRRRAHIIQSAHFYTNLYAGLAARAVGISSIGAIRNDVLSEAKANGAYGIWQLRLPHHLIANTNIGRTRAINRGIAAEHVHFVPNAVDTQSFTPGEYRNGNHAIGILFAGRLTAAKRPDRFIRVFADAVRRLPEKKLRAVVAGHGPLRSQLEIEARNLGLKPGQIEFIGEQSNMSDVFRQSDILMLTSDWEGTPNVILEAMASGRPVIATRVGGVADILNDERGFVVAPENEEGLLIATCQLAGEPALRKTLGLKGAQYVAQNHSIDSLKDRLTSIYERIL